jgi:hypothetical protein
MMSLQEVESQLKALSTSDNQQQQNSLKASSVSPSRQPVNGTSTESTSPVPQHQQQQQQAYPTPSPHDVLASHIYHVGFGQGLYSDLTVHFKMLTPSGEPTSNSLLPDGTMFKLHKLLAIRSPFLASLIQEAEMRGEV